jgi:hypothetical protein
MILIAVILAFGFFEENKVHDQTFRKYRARSPQTGTAPAVEERSRMRIHARHVAEEGAAGMGRPPRIR